MADIDQLMLTRTDQTNQTTSHVKALSWFSNAALALGGANRSVLLVGVVVAMLGPTAVPLLGAGFLIACLAAPAWTELVLMYPEKLGGIAACCTQAFRPYSPVIAALSGVCYWWGSVLVGGFASLVVAESIASVMPHLVSTHLLALSLIVIFACINSLGIKTTARVVTGIAVSAAVVTFCASMLAYFFHVQYTPTSVRDPVTVAFGGVFGRISSVMACVYIVGAGSSGFETSLCFAGETIDQTRNVLRSVKLSALVAAFYFLVFPSIWLYVSRFDHINVNSQVQVAPQALSGVFPVIRSIVMAVVAFNLVLTAVQPLSGASRTLYQLSIDGLVPRFLAKYSSAGCPTNAMIVTAFATAAFATIGTPVFLLAAFNFAYLIGISLPCIAVCLLRNNEPNKDRPFRCSNAMVGGGLIAASYWGISAVLGLQAFGMPTVVLAIVVVYSAIALFEVRRWMDKSSGDGVNAWSLHTKMTAAMTCVLVFDGVGYAIAVNSGRQMGPQLVAVLEDAFVFVTMVSIAIGTVLPGMIAYAAEGIALAASNLATVALPSFSRAMMALGKGDLENAHVDVQIDEINVRSNDEVGEMATSFNLMQREILRAAVGLNAARGGLKDARDGLLAANTTLEQNVCDLREAEERYRSIYKNTAEGIFQTTIDGRYINANPALARIYGFASPEELCTSIQDLEYDLYVNADTRQRFFEFMHNSDRVVDFEAEVRRADGVIIWISENCHAVRAEDGRLIYYEGTVEDITQRKRLEEERETLLEHTRQLLAEAVEQADRDPLTGLLNHRAFQRRFDEEVDRVLRSGGSLSVALIDLDNFKFFNDSYGHSTGDDVIKQIAYCLSSRSRSYDVIARFGGDEFAVLLPDNRAEDPNDVKNGLNRRLSNVSFTPDGAKSSVPINISIGVAVYPGDGATRTDILQIADERLRRAKVSGDSDNTAAALCEMLCRTTGGFSMLNALVTAVDTKDRYTRRHSEDVLEYSVAIAHELGFDDAAIHNLMVSSLLHDVGKIGIPDHILRKPGNLSSEEYECVKQHPVMGAIMVGAVDGFSATLDAIRHHHERWDGRGYPDNLQQDTIPLAARLMAVADSYSAMTMDRPYRKGLIPERALAIVRSGAGSQWDPNCVSAFVSAMAKRGIAIIRE